MTFMLAWSIVSAVILMYLSLRRPLDVHPFLLVVAAIIVGMVLGGRL